MMNLWFRLRVGQRLLARPVSIWVAGMTSALLLSSCGGNSSDAAVTSVSASGTRFSRTATISVNGRNLRQGLIVETEGGCENLTVVANGSDDTQQFTCDVLAVGQHVVHVASSSGAFLARLRFDVPQPQVSLTTSKGNITLELDPAAAPLTARNFLNYVNNGFYPNVIFHRAIAGSLVQAGGYITGPVVKPATAAAIKLESNNGLKNLRGTIGAARTTDPDSATSQWYLNVGDNAGFDYVDDTNPGYAVFGKVLTGLDAMDAISTVETRQHAATGLTNLPVTDVLITAAIQTR